MIASTASGVLHSFGVTNMVFNPAMNDAVPGNIASSSDYNILIDNLLDLDSRVSGISGNQPFCHVYQSSAATQIIAQNTPTALNFDAEVVDALNFHSTVSNTSRITPTVAGRYQCFGGVAWNTNNSAVVNNKYATCQFRKNGSQVLGSSPYGPVLLYQTAFAAPISFTVATILVNGTTDYIQLWGNNDVVGGLGTFSNVSDQHSFMQVRYVSAT